MKQVVVAAEDRAGQSNSGRVKRKCLGALRALLVQPGRIGYSWRLPSFGAEPGREWGRREEFTYKQDEADV